MKFSQRAAVMRRAAREAARLTRRQWRSLPFNRWRPLGASGSRQTIVPLQLRPPEAERARGIYAGRFQLAHREFVFGPDGPFAGPPTGPAPCTVLPAEARAELHAFGWLGDLAAARTPVARANALALVQDWAARWDTRFDSVVWRGDVAARRTTALLRHLPALLDGPEGSKAGVSNEYDAIRPALTRVLARHARNLSTNAGVHRPGMSRLRAHIAVLLYNLCMAGRDRAMEKSAHALDRELQRQIAPDGGHVSRNPAVLPELLADLFVLRQAFIRRGVAPSQTLVSTIDRMGGALRMLRHSNGAIPRFNGTGTVDEAMLSAVLRHDPPPGDAPTAMTHTGYDRLSRGRTVVLVDSGRATDLRAAPDAMAGTLSFEMSSGDRRFIINCGQPDIDVERMVPFARKTAAHSTATIGGKSSSIFLRRTGGWASRLLPPLSQVPPTVNRSRTSDDGDLLRMDHDGYGDRFGLVHERTLHLSRPGGALDGTDRFSPVRSDPDGSAPAVIRFHLAPGLSVSLLASGHSILIAASGGDAWTFTCVDVLPQIEESIRFDGPDGSRRCEQIALHVPAPLSGKEVRWTLRRKSAAPMPSPRAFRRATGDKGASAKPRADLLTPLAGDEPDGV